MLEFGSGVSTVFIAEVLNDVHQHGGPRGKVVSYEQNPTYHDQYVRHLPKDTLGEFIDLRLRPVRVTEYKDAHGSARGIHFEEPEYPTSARTLVYIDGPTRPRGCPECDVPFTRINSDLLEMHKQGAKWHTAVTDHRYACAPTYRRALRDTYNVTHSALWRSLIVR